MKNTVLKIWRFYVDGFRGMTLGRTLWFIILVKLFIMFFILRLFFFPNYLNTPAVAEIKKSMWAGNSSIVLLVIRLE